MKKRLYPFFLAPLFLFLLQACEREGELIIKPVKEIKPFTMGGFVVGDTLELYFDGVKVREIYGRVYSPGSTDKIAFDKDVLLMELKRKSNKEQIYQQNFSISNDTTKVPRFYFDGTKLHASYDYPTPQGIEYLANFYFDFPAKSPTVDVVIEVEEFYYDASQGPDPISLGTTTIPVMTNVQTGKWSAYAEIKIPVLEKHHPESMFQAYAFLKEAGTAKYYVNNKKDDSYYDLQLPDEYTSEGKVQSKYVQLQKSDGKWALNNQQDLLDIFGR